MKAPKASPIMKGPKPTSAAPHPAMHDPLAAPDNVGPSLPGVQDGFSLPKAGTAAPKAQIVSAAPKAPKGGSVKVAAKTSKVAPKPTKTAFTPLKPRKV